MNSLLENIVAFLLIAIIIGEVIVKLAHALSD
jgi:hypothetical protein